MKTSTIYAISCFGFILLAILLVYDLGWTGWVGAFAALYAGACYGWCKEEKLLEGCNDNNKHEKK